MLRLLICIFIVFGHAIIAAPPHIDETWRDSTRNRDVPLRLRLPTGEGPFPVLLISHGLGGSRRGIAYLAEAARDAGWLCINIQHHGSDEQLWKGKPPAKILPSLMAAIRKPQPGIDRVADMSFVIDELTRRHAKSGNLKSKAALKNIAIAGHSFGAWTVYAAVGRRSAKARRFEKHLKLSEPDKRIRAIIALSPTGEKTLALERNAVADIHVPSLNISGSKDTSAVQRDLQIIQRRYPFDALPKTAHPAYLLWFDDADHMVFGGDETGRKRFPRKARYNQQVQTIVAKASIDFLNREVLHNPKADILADPKKSSMLMNKLGKIERKFPTKP